MNKLLLAAACLLLLQLASRAEDPAADPIAAKITAAKDAFYAERDKADEALVKLLERKEATAKQAGDIKTLEAVRAELDAFRKEGTLPKLVPVTIYNMAMKVARTKLENVYLAAIKSALQANNLDSAKTIQKQLDEFRNAPLKAENLSDPIQAKTVWISATKKGQLEINERKGDEITATADIHGNGDEIRQYKGTIKDGKIVWLGKDTKMIRPENMVYEQNHYGTVSKDEQGWKIDFQWYKAKGKLGGSYTMRLNEVPENPK